TPPAPAELPDRVQWLTVSVPSLAMPPPAPKSPTELPDRVLSLAVAVPKLKMPPPKPPAELPDRVLPLTVSVPRLRMAPPRLSRAAVPLGLSARPLPAMRFKLSM